MESFRVNVKQSYRATREITVTVQADSLESAIEAVASGAEDLPPFRDPGWLTTWDLQNEEYEAA